MVSERRNVREEMSDDQAGRAVCGQCRRAWVETHGLVTGALRSPDLG